MAKFHVEFDLDYSGECDEGEEGATLDDIEETIVSQMTNGFAIELSNFKITKK